MTAEDRRRPPAPPADPRPISALGRGDGPEGEHGAEAGQSRPDQGLSSERTLGLEQVLSLEQALGPELPSLGRWPQTGPSPAPGAGRWAETTARRLVTGAGGLIVAVLASVALFLLAQGWPALGAGAGQLPAGATDFWSLAWPLAFGSIWASALALLLAAPLATAIALFTVHYLPRRWRPLLSTAIDLLAAVPSVIYGLWGLMVFAPLVAHLYPWLNAQLGWLPFFAGRPSATGRTILTAALVLAVMIVPIIAAVAREVMAQTPVGSIEAAVALGATRWETARLAVLPWSRSGIVAGSMLGLGRALGETMAVAMVLSPTPFWVSLRLLESTNPNTVSAFIAQTFPEAHGLQVNSLIALGLILFALTFVVNALARRVARPRTVRERPGGGLGRRRPALAGASLGSGR